VVRVLRDRLVEAELDTVVASYYSGTSVSQLTRLYNLNHRSVNKLIQERDPSVPPGRHGSNRR
jgi:hypothetical protein